MKKLFFTLALLISVFALSAQSYTVTLDGAVVENGATYYVYDDGSASWGEPGGEIQIEFTVTANENMRLVGKKTPINLVDGTTTWICFGQCLAPSTTVQETEPYQVTAGEGVLLSGHYMADDYMAVLGQAQQITLEIWDASNPDDKFTINVTFTYSLEGIEDYNSVETFSNAYPVPARDVVNFDYNFASSENAEVAIYNMMGQEVLRNNISGMSGKLSINVSDLTDGVYFYSLIVNGKTEKSSKLVVRH